MKHFLSTTALIAIIGTAGYADNHSGAFIEYKVTSETDLFASELIGMRVYVAEADMDAATPVSEGARAQWDDIGEINEIVLTRDGQVAAVIVGVGGFLGIGERDVAINMAELSVMHEDSESDDFFLVVQSSREMLENAPAFEHAEMGNAETEMSDGENAQAAENAMEQPVMAAPEVEREGYAIAEREQLTAEVLTGTRVYGANDEDVGEVSEILISDDGQIESVVIDVGGFLGIGERPVALTFDELTILRNEGGDDFRIYINATQEALEQRPEYEG